MIRVGALLIAFAVVLNGTPVYSQSKMTPLRSYITKNQNPNDANALYIFSRCSALFTVLAALSPNKNMRNVMQIKGEHALSGAVMLLKKVRGGTTEELTKNALKTVSAIGKEYIDESNHNYTITGNYVKGSDLIETDVDVCGTLSK